MNEGVRLKQYAKKEHGGVVKLALKLGIAQPLLSNYISGKIKPGYELLSKLAGLGCDINYLLTGAVKVGGVKEPGVEYNAVKIEERLSKLESELEKVKARNYDLIEENKNLWEAVTELGQYNQVLTLLHAKANHHLSSSVDPPNKL